MTLALNTLAEAYTTEISKQQNPQSLGPNINVAMSGGNVAKVADNKKISPQTMRAYHDSTINYI